MRVVGSTDARIREKIGNKFLGGIAVAIVGQFGWGLQHY
jgi:hypothetical protein